MCIDLSLHFPFYFHYLSTFETSMATVDSIDQNPDETNPAPLFTINVPETSSSAPKESLEVEPDQDDDDRILSTKMTLVNSAIDEIGFTSYQLKLFFLNGFGYAVDSLLILLNALTQPQVALQYQPKVSKTQSIAANIGLLIGALFWGLGADVSSYRTKTPRIHASLDYRPSICIQHNTLHLFNLCYHCRCITELSQRLYFRRSDDLWWWWQFNLGHGSLSRISSR